MNQNRGRLQTPTHVVLLCCCSRKRKKAELIRLIEASGTDRGKVFPVTRKSRKFFSYCGSSTDSFSHRTVSSMVQLWTDKNKEGSREKMMFLLSLKAHTQISNCKHVLRWFTARYLLLCIPPKFPKARQHSQSALSIKAKSTGCTQTLPVWRVNEYMFHYQVEINCRCIILLLR